MAFLDSILLALAALLAPQDPAPAAELVLVVGAPGKPEYGAQFAEWAERWTTAATSAGTRVVSIGPPSGEPSGELSDRERLRAFLEEEAAASSAPLWIVYLGHGTFDGELAKWNLRGPDVSDAELATWLAPLERPLAVVVCAAAAGSFLPRLSGSGRVVLTATRSGNETSFSRFGDSLSRAWSNPEADLDKDEAVSLLEAYLFASARVAEFYADAARLATEHSLLDDNGDGLGTPAPWFRGVRCRRVPKGGQSPDGARAHLFHLVPEARDLALSTELRQRRDALEAQLVALREREAELEEADYLARLEPILLELARLYRDQ